MVKENLIRKNLLIVIALLFFSIGVSQNRVNVKNLVKYGDKYFAENDDRPFNGIVFDISRETGNKILEYRMVNGIKDGSYKIWDEDGNSITQGIFKDGLIIGEWKFYDKIDDKIYIGKNWEELLNGDFYRNGNFFKVYPNYKIKEFFSKVGNRLDKVGWYENGQKSEESTFKDDKLDGLYTEWYENGKKKNESFHKDGKRHGLFTEWYEHGYKKYEGTFKNGKQDGLITNWGDNGGKEKQITYKDGIKNGLWTEYNHHTDKKIYEGNYKDGLKEGVWTKWMLWASHLIDKEETYEKGELIYEKNLEWWEQGDLIYEGFREGPYKDGKKDGTWTYWNENGQKEWEKIFGNEDCSESLSRKKTYSYHSNGIIAEIKEVNLACNKKRYFTERKIFFNDDGKIEKGLFFTENEINPLTIKEAVDKGLWKLEGDEKIAFEEYKGLIDEQKDQHKIKAINDSLFQIWKPKYLSANKIKNKKITKRERNRFYKKRLWTINGIEYEAIFKDFNYDNFDISFIKNSIEKSIKKERTWTTKSGSSFNAKLVNNNNGKVTLEKYGVSGGFKFGLKIEDLSPKDSLVVESLGWGGKIITLEKGLFSPKDLNLISKVTRYKELITEWGYVREELILNEISRKKIDLKWISVNDLLNKY